jgi:hypothetical protein
MFQIEGSLNYIWMSATLVYCDKTDFLCIIHRPNFNKTTFPKRRWTPKKFTTMEVVLSSETSVPTYKYTRFYYSKEHRKSGKCVFQNQALLSRFKHGRTTHHETSTSGIMAARQLLSCATVTKVCSSFTNVYINTIGTPVRSASFLASACDSTGPGEVQLGERTLYSAVSLALNGTMRTTE